MRRAQAPSHRCQLFRIKPLARTVCLLIRGAVALAMLALVVAPGALAARAASPPAASPGLLGVGAGDSALVRLGQGAASPAGGELLSRRLGIWRVPGRVVPSLVRRGDVLAVEPDEPIELHVEPLQGTQFWRPLVGADSAVPPGPGKPITMLDTGIDLTHPEFAGRPNTSILGVQTLVDSGDDFHGTATSSVAAAPANGVGILGVYPQAVLRSVDVRRLRTSDVVRGLSLAIEAGPSVINMSFGVPPSELLLDTVSVAFRTGSILVAASGNERQIGTPIAAPASLNHVLTIAATDQRNRTATFSTSSLQVDLAAPGVDIPAAIPIAFNAEGYSKLSGTSFAAPIVTGATAWVWTARPQLDNTQVFDLMRWSATDVEGQGFDRDTGYGLLNIPAALARPAPSSDRQEPNDDIRQVRANGLFRTASAPITAPGRPRAAFGARLDRTEDPEDVYRVYVPPRRVVRVTVTHDTDVDIDLWKASASSVFLRGSARTANLFDTSTRRGRTAERVSVRNGTSRGLYAYLDVYVSRNGPLTAAYTVSVATARR
jgi:subtilisin family serine protease